MTVATTLSVRVRALTWEAEGILGIELVPLEATQPLPAFDAGAHIDLHLGNGLVRSYSLLNAPGERHRYCVAVHKDPASRGGSRWLHEQLHAGDVLTIGTPRNNFALDESAPLSVFIAGGIGVTPILGMIRRLVVLGKPWRLHYGARTPAHAAYLDELRQLAEGSGQTLDVCFDQTPDGRRFDLPALVAALPPDAHVYCCGPLGMLDAFTSATAALPRPRVHLEYFAAKEGAAREGGYHVSLARSGREVEVQPGQTLLDALIAIGAEPLYSCREGVCGTCEVGVLEGIPDHRDLVMSDEEKSANKRMMVCCSGAKTARLVLDL